MSLHDGLTTEQLGDLIYEVRTRKEHLRFMRHCWRGMAPLVEGFHTRRICARIDRAIEDFRNGKNSYILINVHPRSGKSDIVSRYLGPHFLGEFPKQEVMQLSFEATLAEGFSAFARGVITSDPFAALYPDFVLSTDTNRKDHYLTDQGGGLMATGLHGHLTGSGYGLGILDDYCAGREDAESLVKRDKNWSAFTDDFMTRRAPVSITLVLATWWHEDDITGRIIKAMADDPAFPRFDILTFPARAIDYKGDGQYSGKYLFEERLGKEWYEAQYATLGKYSAAALMDCNPLPRTGGRFNLEHIDWFDALPENKNLRWVRVWDLAHTAKQRSGDDPDYTSGTKLAFERVPGDPVPHLWVANVFRTRDDAPARDQKIKAIAEQDGTYTRQAVESSLDAKDSFLYLRNAMPSISWNKINALKGDKATRATPLEPIFEAPGHVHVLRGTWNDQWLDELMRFDGLGKEHDDQVDNLSAGYIFCIGMAITGGTYRL